MSSPQEDKPSAGDTKTPTPAAPTTVVSVSGPLRPPGESTWGAGPGLNVRYAGRSAVGLVREHNEDNFVIANLTSGAQSPREASLTDVVGEGGLLFAVCDGMGGAAAGEVASQMAVDVLHEAMRRGGFPRERDVLARRLVAAVEEAGRRIFDAAQKERSRRGMGTTATAAVLIDKVLFLAEVGDSRAYLLRNGELKQLTKDQSLVNQLIEAGHLTEAEAEAFEHSNIILQALGTSETVQVDLTFVELRRGDRLMLCSDGLSGLVHSDTLRDTLANIDDPSECTGALVKFAEAGGGHDNITVVVIDFDGEDLDLPRDTDSFGYLQYPLLPSSSVAGAFSEEEVTEATKPLTRSSLDSLPAYQPPAGPGVDSNPWAWISAGVLALVAGAWLFVVSGNSGAATAGQTLAAEPDRTVAPAERPEEKPEEALAQAKVPVRVYSDVQDAVLLVNGEAHGPLPAVGEGQTLDLPPCAYRFEAQSHGNIAAVEVVTVKPDAPLDVYLRLPSGANEPGGAARAAAAQPGEAAPARDPQDDPAARDVKDAKPAEAAAAADAPKPNGVAPAAAPVVEKRPAAVAAAPRPRERRRKPVTADAAATTSAPSTESAPAAPAPTPAPAAEPAPQSPKPESPIPANPF